MLKEDMVLDDLVELHTRNRKKIPYYSQQFTLILALICLVFFGSIVIYNGGITTTNHITGMAFYISHSDTDESVRNGFSTLNGFVTAVKTSPDVTMYKLFFYTVWILVVLIGSAIYYEVEK